DELGGEVLGVAGAAAVPAEQDLPAGAERARDQLGGRGDVVGARVDRALGRRRGLAEVGGDALVHRSAAARTSSRIRSAASRRSATTWSANGLAASSSSGPWPVRTRIVVAPKRRPISMSPA